MKKKMGGRSVGRMEDMVSFKLFGLKKRLLYFQFGQKVNSGKKERKDP